MVFQVSIFFYFARILFILIVCLGGVLQRKIGTVRTWTITRILIEIIIRLGLTKRSLQLIIA